jgi:hypothetical protein
MRWTAQVFSLFLLLQFATACEKTKDTRHMPSTDDASEEQLASSPAPVTGSYLRCSYLDDPNSSGTTAVGCNPYDANHKIIDLDSAGSEVRWSFESRLLVTFTKNYVDAQGVRWQGRFDFAGTDTIDRLAQILETQITLSFVKNSTGQTITLQDKIRNLLMGLAEHRYVKVAYESIHMNPPMDSTVLPDTVEFVLKIDGVWEKVRIRLDSLDFTAHTMESDRFQFQFKGSEADWRMYLGTGMGRDLAEILSSTRPELLNWSTANGDGWTFDPSSSFANQEPYDLKTSAKPIEVIIDMGMKKRFHGFRLDGGRADPARQFPNGFPDRLHFLYSDDGINWKKYEGSEISLNARSSLEWSWEQ